MLFCIKRIALCSFACLYTIVLSTHVQAQNNNGYVSDNSSSTHYRGELINITNNAIILNIKGQTRTVPLQRPLNRTHIHVNGKTTLDVLRPGMKLRVEGKLDSQNSYKISNAKFSILMHSDLTQSTIDQNGKMLLMGTVSGINPLRIRGIPTSMLSAEKLPNGARRQFQVKNREFQVTLMKVDAIPIEFGKNLKFAGNAPRAHVVIPKVNGVAQSVTLHRKEIVTAANLGLKNGTKSHLNKQP